MESGELSTLFWALIGLSGGAGVTAYSISGHKARNLWILCFALTTAAVVLEFGFPSWAATYAASAVTILWVLYPMLTIGAVALVVEDRRQPATAAETAEAPTGPAFPRFATSPTTRWQPDISLRQAVRYLGAESTWRYEYGQNDTKNTTEALTIALYANKITAWGREHPGEGEHFEIQQGFWRSVETTIENDYVFSNGHQIGAYDIQLCRKQMELVWPPKNPPSA